jgi:predicted nucleotidyltransferase
MSDFKELQEKKMVTGKYAGEKFKDIPQSYVNFVIENHKENAWNRDLKYYGFLLKEKQKKELSKK